LGNSLDGGDGAGLPGYVARPVTFHDLDAVEGFLIDVDVSSFGEAESSRIWLEEAWSSDWTHLPTMSRLVIAADGTAAGYADLEAVDPSKEIGAFARVHPRHLGRGLGAALVGWTRRTAARMVAPGRSVTLRHSIAGPDRSARRLLEREGFRHVRTAWHMRMDLPPGYAAGDPPPGVSIRPSVAGADDLAIWETMDAAFRTHFGFQPVGFEQWWDNTRRTGTYDPSLILVAVLDERIVGVSHQFTPPRGATGWVGDLGVRPEVQGRGIGRALLRHALADLARRGLRTAQLNVDSENQTGAVELYRSVGMGVHREWLDLDATIEGIGPV
jgi:mycothiol synthase